MIEHWISVNVFVISWCICQSFRALLHVFKISQSLWSNENCWLGRSLNAIRWIYKHHVIDILYKQIWFISALCSLFINYPPGCRVSVLSCELSGLGLHPTWAIFSVTFHFQLNYRFFVGQLALVGLEFSIRVSGKFSFCLYSIDDKLFWIATGIDVFLYWMHCQ